MTKNTTSAASPSVVVTYGFMVAYLVGLSAFGSFVNDMYLPTLPSMLKFFKCSVPMVEMGLAMGMAGLAAGEFVLGPVSDKYGRKPVLLGSLLTFCVAAVVSIFSPTIWFFLICRFVQGCGASGAYFLARSIPADMYSGRMLAKTMAVIGAINGFAPASAPVLGALISDKFHWQGVFVALTIIAVILLCFSPRLKETLTPDRRFKGSLGKSFGNYLTLLKNRRFMVYVLVKGSGLGLLFAYISSAPFIIQTHFGFSQIHFGLVIGANALLVAAGSMTALRFKQLKRAAPVAAIGLVAVIAAQMVVLLVVDKFLPYELLMLPTLFFLGMIFTVGNTLAMNEGREFAGDASAILGIMGYVFGAAVSPLVGVGNVLHSTAWVFGALTIIILISSLICNSVKENP